MYTKVTLQDIQKYLTNLQSKIVTTNMEYSFKIKKQDINFFKYKNKRYRYPPGGYILISTGKIR